MLVLTKYVMALQRRLHPADFLLLLVDGQLVETYATTELVYIYNNYCTLFCISTAQDFRFAEEGALAIGGEDRIHTHVVIEMHYDNPEEIPSL